MTIEYKDSKRIVLNEADRTLTHIQGYDGGASAGSGGGGAGGVGGDGTVVGTPTANTGTGGIGITSTITGSSVDYAGGGGGKYNYNGVTFAGTASHGGGAGSHSSGTNGVDGKGGGGGGSGYNINGADGGDGVLILRFDSSNSYSTTGSPTVDTSSVSGKTILTYSAGSGGFTLNSDFDVEYLLIAGGGGGGRDGYSVRWSNGGGAGGVLQGTASMTSGTYPITVGTGGAGGNGNSYTAVVGGDGTDSTFNGMTSVGGGGGIGHGSGAPYTSPARDGGSGGGSGGSGTTSTSDVTPTNVQDNSILVEKDTANRYWFTSGVDDDITWDSSSAVNVSISGNTATATGSTGWDKAVQSTQTWTPSDEPTLEFTVTGSPLNQMVGFGKGTLGTSYTTLDFGLYTESGLGVYENGVQKYNDSSTNPSSSDTFKVTMDSNGLVQYWHNGSVFYNSPQTASGTYYAQFTPKTSASTTTVSFTTPATWTMQPTFQDDFSSDKGWVSSDAQAKIDSSGYLLFDEDGDGSAHIVYYDIGRTLSDTKWLWRFKLTTNTFSMNSDPTPQMVHIRISDNTTQRDVASEDAIGMSFRTSDGNQKYIRTTYSDGAIFGTTSNFSTQIATGTHYVQITRDSSTQFTVKLYSDSSYSTLVESKPITIPSTITDLRYLKIDNYDQDGTGNGTILIHIDDMEVYSGVTSKN